LRRSLRYPSPGTRCSHGPATLSRRAGAAVELLSRNVSLALAYGECELRKRVAQFLKSLYGPLYPLDGSRVMADISGCFPNSKLFDAVAGFKHAAQPAWLATAATPGLGGPFWIPEFGRNLPSGLARSLQLVSRSSTERLKALLQLASLNLKSLRKD
jgi:hypothetical protein